MKKLKINYKDIISSCIIFLVGSILLFLGMAFVGNKPQIYNDIIVETVAHYGTNETGELSVFWSILFLGIPILLLVSYFINRNSKAKEYDEDIKTITAIELVVCVANIVYFVINGFFNSTLVMVAILSFINYIINPNEQKKRTST